MFPPNHSPDLELGIVLRDATFAAGAAALQDTLARVDAAGIDFVGVLDHLTFWDGSGFDGLVHATAVAAAHPTLPVRTTVYVLPLRHPVPVARQLCSLAALAPSRVTFGVGIGGEDRREVAAAGVDAASRGRRMDESLVVLGRLLQHGRCTFDGEFFVLDDVRMAPIPAGRIPVLIGGRSAAALARTARFGDGWLGFAVSPDRFAAATASVERLATSYGRVAEWNHGMVIWCGLGPDRHEARTVLAAEMEALYKIPFSRFERYCAFGAPEDVAATVDTYQDAGCQSFNLIACAAPGFDVVDAVGRCRELVLGGVRKRMTA